MSLKQVFPFFILYFHRSVCNYDNRARCRRNLRGRIHAAERVVQVLYRHGDGGNRTHTDIVRLVRTGRQTDSMGMACWAGITAGKPGMQHVLGMW